MCHKASGPETRYTRRRIDSLHLWCTPDGSVLNRDNLTLSHCTRSPLLRKWPIIILRPIPGLFFCASITFLSSSSLVRSAYVPRKQIAHKLNTLYYKISSLKIYCFCCLYVTIGNYSITRC